jgi:hypothetical protein
MSWNFHRIFVSLNHSHTKIFIKSHFHSKCPKKDHNRFVMKQNFCYRRRSALKILPAKANTEKKMYTDFHFNPMTLSAGNRAFKARNSVQYCKVAVLRVVRSPSFRRIPARLARFQKNYSITRFFFIKQNARATRLHHQDRPCMYVVHVCRFVIFLCVSPYSMALPPHTSLTLSIFFVRFF